MSSDKTTILTCPSCMTRYNVKADAIPPEGRTVRCAACSNKWRAMPEEPDAEPDEAVASPTGPVPYSAPPPVPDAEEAPPPPPPVEAEVESEPADDFGDEPVVAAPPEPEVAEEINGQAERQEEVIEERATEQMVVEEPATDMAFTGPDPDAEPLEDDHAADELHDEEASGSRWWLWVLLLVILVGGAIAALFTVAPAEWRQQLGIEQAGVADSPFEFVIERQNHSRLASGQSALAITARIINVSGDEASVPPIRVELRDAADVVQHSWIAAPPTPSLGPGESASFNSAEVDLPISGDDHDIVLIPTS